jgi:hypothetical protein
MNTNQIDKKQAMIPTPTHEHAALVAVAEAAEFVCNGHNFGTLAVQSLEQALANLAAVREGKV